MPNFSTYDAAQIARLIYDEATNAVRVAVNAAISGVQEVLISQSDDSIQSCPFRGTISESATTAASTTSATFLAANADRKYLLVQNLDLAINIFLRFGTAATTTAPSIKLEPGDSYEFPEGFISTQTVNIIAASGTPAVTVIQGS